MITLQLKPELNNLKSYLELVKDIPGDVIEVGVYMGGSAEVLKGDKKLILCDSFQDVGDGMGHMFDFNGVYESVCKDFPDALIIKGEFPQSAHDIGTLSFIHLDVDSYKATKECLEYLYPKLQSGGVIISHDYLNAGLRVKEAVDEFMKDKEMVIPLFETSQCVIIKS